MDFFFSLTSSKLICYSKNPYLYRLFKKFLLSPDGFFTITRPSIITQDFLICFSSLSKANVIFKLLANNQSTCWIHLKTFFCVGNLKHAKKVLLIISYEYYRGFGCSSVNFVKHQWTVVILLTKFQTKIHLDTKIFVLLLIYGCVFCHLLLFFGNYLNFINIP